MIFRIISILAVTAICFLPAVAQDEPAPAPEPVAVPAEPSAGLQSDVPPPSDAAAPEPVADVPAVPAEAPSGDTTTDVATPVASEPARPSPLGTSGEPVEPASGESVEPARPSALGTSDEPVEPASAEPTAVAVPVPAEATDSAGSPRAETATETPAEAPPAAPSAEPAVVAVPEPATPADSTGSPQAETGAGAEEAPKVVEPASPSTLGTNAEPARGEPVESAGEAQTPAPTGKAVTEHREPAGERRGFWRRFFSSKSESSQVEADMDRKELEEIQNLVKQDIEAANGKATPEENAVEVKELSEKILTPQEEVAMQEEIRRQAKEIEGMKALDAANGSMQKGEWEAALKQFNQALQLIQKRPQTMEIRKKAMSSQAECEYRMALDFYGKGNRTEAMAAVDRALGYDGAHRKAMRLRDKLKIIAAPPKTPKVPLAWEEESFLDKEAKIAGYMKKGKDYITIGEFDKARLEFRKILLLDNNNVDAKNNLKLIAERQMKINTKGMEATQKDMLQEVRGKWTPPPAKLSSRKLEETKDGGTIMTSQERQKLIQK
ncbi:MAG: hypothetical protein HY343_09080, partial [Lentisphaerae bacterium]|nr:hypothetical protein [Lentisphaerota bacterium]